jgi:hypothetical protein
VVISLALGLGFWQEATPLMVVLSVFFQFHVLRQQLTFSRSAQLELLRMTMRL